jgi:hypothetical protein
MLFCCLMFMLPALGQDSSSVSVLVDQSPPEAKSGILHLIWAFANSAVGVTLISGALFWILGRIFTASPKAEQLVNTYKGLFFDAVRHAEKTIPDGSPNTSASRADAALKFILQLEPALAKKKEADVRAALNIAHSALEEKANGEGIV